MRKRTLIGFLILLSFPAYLTAQSRILFFEEHIDFKLDSKFFSINGIYSFYNNSDDVIIKQIIFPFAVKIKLIDSIRVIDLNSRKMLNYNILVDAISFNLILQPKDTLDVNIFYRQIVSIKNTYILTTTQIWGNPLDKAVYTLTAPKGMAINSFSYIPDSVKLIDNNRLYKWEKYHFSPKIDFDIIIGTL